jgi:uncharacterized protein YbjQ (UPF0145 family)
MRASSHVTTTSSIDGWRVNSYLGVVASHVVAGTGFGSDILASFSDFFGGRSGAYQHQLTSLYGEAIGQLHRKAQKLGGNWIIGLRVDIDEVSGKGTQMFMVTAIGTAVRASPDPAKTEPVSGSIAVDHAGGGDLERMERRLKIAAAVRAKELLLEPQTWEFIVDQRVEEAAPAVLEWAASAQQVGSSWEAVPEQDRRRPLAYFQALPAETATHILHEALCDAPQIAKAAIGIMRDLSLVSLRASLQGLRSTNPDLRRRVVQALEAYQQTYVEADVAVIDDLINELPGTFQEGPDVIQARGLLGGKKDRWVCESCGQQNSIATKRCGKCTRDIQGFLPTEITPERAVAILRERRRALAALFGMEGRPVAVEREKIREPNRTTVST